MAKGGGWWLRLSAHKHEYTERVKTVTPATCTEGGADQYKCKYCAATKTVKTEALGHDFSVTVEKLEPTCTEDGCSAYHECSRCGKNDGTKQVLSATGHSWRSVEAKKPTCTETGHTAYRECRNCGEKTDNYVVIPATGHSFGDWKAVKGTDTHARTCSGCGEKKTTKHLPDRAKVENLKKAGIGKEGSYDEVTYCLLCGEELSRITVKLDPLDDDPEDKDDPEDEEIPEIEIPPEIIKTIEKIEEAIKDKEIKPMIPEDIWKKIEEKIEEKKNDRKEPAAAEKTGEQPEAAPEKAPEEETGETPDEPPEEIPEEAMYVEEGDFYLLLIDLIDYDEEADVFVFEREDEGKFLKDREYTALFAALREDAKNEDDIDWYVLDGVGREDGNLDIRIDDETLEELAEMLYFISFVVM